VIVATDNEDKLRMSRTQFGKPIIASTPTDSKYSMAASASGLLGATLFFVRDIGLI
jgi:hypothetical protein